MARVKRGVTTHARHKKVIKQAKGYQGRGRNAYRVAIERVEKALQYAYRDRRVKKRNFRALWIQRINAGAREHGLTYSQLMNGLRKAGVELDRKVLSDLAVREPAAFKSLVEQAQGALAAGPKAGD
ncbi:MAG: 50S ribosomal protein L20 [Kiloniellales bacterium]|jgi:large subunit ribosomal protein L20|nr:50S ribosomal protein L20 [Kiloniellales bacterium]